MKDFTPGIFRNLLQVLRDQGYDFMTFRDYLENGSEKVIMLRHDVDRRPENALEIARLENSLGIQGSYYFRMVPQSYNRNVIGEIHALGHEIGYHYEDMSTAARKKSGRVTPDQLANEAVKAFRNNLQLLRSDAPVKTICMHGSPLSGWDSRLIWKYFDYREQGVTGEPYFDLNLEDFLYLTDTGRRWNGSSVSLRDKGSKQYLQDQDIRNKGELPFSSWKVKPLSGSAVNYTDKAEQFQRRFNIRTTRELIVEAGKGILPPKIMITSHPQRWTDRKVLWIKELAGQSVKNCIKYFIIKTKIR